MGRDYLFICVDCRVSLHLGQVYSSQQHPGEWTFDGVHLDSDRKFHKRDEIFGRVMEKFLLHHRNHVLTVVPSGADGIIEEVVGPLSSLEADDILDEPFQPPVDWAGERDKWFSIRSRSDPSGDVGDSASKGAVIGKTISRALGYSTERKDA